MDALKAEIRKRKAEARSGEGGGGGGDYAALSDVQGESSLQGGAGASKHAGRGGGAAQAVEQERGGKEKRREEEVAQEKRRALKEARAERDRKRAKKLNVNAKVDECGGARDDGNASGSADATAAAASKDASLIDSQDATAAAAAHSLSELNSILETQRGLRAKGEPIQLFGESIKERRLRLRALELLEERGGGAGRSGQNDFMRAMAGAEAKDAEVALEAARRAELGMSSSADKFNLAKEGKDTQGDTQEGEEAQKKEKESVEEKGREGVGMNSLLDLELVKKDIDKVYPIIYYTLKGLLRDWEEALAQRSLEVRQTTQGKLMAATQVQSAEYLKPLFKQLRQRAVLPDVLMRLAEIVHYVQKRQYRYANDSYLQLSIGNAPWPIGVTMVGIHERSGREKIFSSNVAHVLNDEVSRKYIQSLKRLMTFAQTKYPPKDASFLMG
ncbi:U5 snRNP-associated RNA splicing factor [Ceraceosorus bombacis]|uniref:Pre-mRNA-splicing factor 18 n=1 Tax=Ceraceosorus bombacis TaxID=401625 RepID=A0A0P1B9W4_9BASI|nr:U5 snRNP-associated RNA splicing factor [Ceraceosorus bombacis]